MKVVDRDNFNRRDTLVAKCNCFVLCIGILIVQEGQPTANDFDNILSKPTTSSSLPLT